MIAERLDRWAESLIAQGKAEGEARGKAEGEARGRAEGEARGRAEGLLDLILMEVAEGERSREAALTRIALLVERGLVPEAMAETAITKLG